MNKQDITILTLWSNETVIVKMDIEDFIQMQKQDLMDWEKEFYIASLRRTITYSDIKWKQWKTNFISDTKLIEAPKKIELTDDERKARDKMINEMLEKTYEWRKKTFFKTREWILKDLAKAEKRFDLQTTLEKIEELNKLRQKNILINNK